MENKSLENWQEFNQKALAAAKELEVINSRLIEQLTGKQMEMANMAFETGTRYMSAMTEAKGFQDVVGEQTKLMTEFNQSLIEAARSSADILSEAREAYQAWFEQGMKTLTNNANFKIPALVPVTKSKASKAA